MNQLATKKRIQILSALVEGNSIRSTVRMTGAAKNTVVKLLRDTGRACMEYHDKNVVNLPCKRVQVDEIWSFCYAKQKNVPKQYKGQFGYGDVWTWVALDADTKFVPSWLVGPRTFGSAKVILRDLAYRVRDRIQLTTDPYPGYYEAVINAFGREVDYAQLGKIYDIPNIYPSNHPLRYRESKVVGCQVKILRGQPEQQHISTSYVERQNLTMRMSIRRFTRSTNGFSKKVENLAHAVSLHFTYYNFCRKHKSLGTSPAIAAGISDHLWKIEEIIDLLKEGSN